MASKYQIAANNPGTGTGKGYYGQGRYLGGSPITAARHASAGYWGAGRQAGRAQALAAFGNGIGVANSGGAAAPGSYQSAYDKAKAANEAREKEITTGLTDLQTRTMTRAERMANQQLADTKAAHGANRAGMTQQMINAGLSGSTVLPTMQAGSVRQEQADLRRLNDGILQRDIEYDRRAALDLLGFRERIEDQYPDYNQMLALAQGVGAAGGGGGVSMGGGYAVPQQAWGGPQMQARGISRSQQMSGGGMLGLSPAKQQQLASLQQQYQQASQGKTGVMLQAIQEQYQQALQHLLGS